jgi:uncharacterized protein (TIGR00266 family)
MSADTGWYYAQNQQSVGPMPLEELIRLLPSVGGESTLVFWPGLANWLEARHVAAIRESLRGNAAPPSPPPAQYTTRRAHEIDYEIFGSEMQYVEITLDPQETVVAEAGGMMYMSRGIEMKTVFGDPSAEQSGFFGKLMSAGKRVLTGESLFMTTFTAIGGGREQIAFAAPYPGKLVPMHLDELGGELICQKDSFLCAAKGVQIGIAFQKKIMTGLFGGEGFILQRLTGHGIAFAHAGGTIQRRELKSGETLRLDTGCLVALQPSVDYDIEMVGGIKNAIFGGEGLFMATLRGPGIVWIQSLPFTRLAGRVLANLPMTGRGKDSGSILGDFANIFESRS